MVRREVSLVALCIGACVLVVVGAYVNRAALPIVLHKVDVLRENRSDPRIIGGLFMAVVLGSVCAVLPTGSLLLSCAAVGFVYGPWGILLAWPGYSLGHFLLFGFARLCAVLRGERCQCNQCLECKRCPTLGEKTRALLRSVSKNLEERPLRTAILLTMVWHPPSMMALLGFATGLSWRDALAACAVDGVRSSGMVLKGALAEGAVDILTGRSSLPWWMLALQGAFLLAMMLLMFFLIQSLWRDLVLEVYDPVPGEVTKEDGSDLRVVPAPSASDTP